MNFLGVLICGFHFVQEVMAYHNNPQHFLLIKDSSMVLDETSNEHAC